MDDKSGKGTNLWLGLGKKKGEKKINCRACIALELPAKKSTGHLRGGVPKSSFLPVELPREKKGPF